MITNEEYAVRPLSIDAVFKQMADLGIYDLNICVGMLIPTMAEKPVTIELEQGMPYLVIRGTFLCKKPTTPFQPPWWFQIKLTMPKDKESFSGDFEIWLNDLPEVALQIQENGYATLVDKNDAWRSVRSKCQYEMDKEINKIRMQFLPELVHSRLEARTAEEAFAADLKKRTSQIVIDVVFRS